MRSWIYHHSGLVVGITPASFEASHRKGGIVKPHPIKAILGLSDLFNILFSQAQEIKRLRAENAAKDKTIVEMRRHAKGIMDAWNDGVLSMKELK